MFIGLNIMIPLSFLLFIFMFIFTTLGCREALVMVRHKLRAILAVTLELLEVAVVC